MIEGWRETMKLEKLIENGTAPACRTGGRNTVGWLYLLVCSLALVSIQVHAVTYVNISILESAITKGAVCLDGSPAAYYYFKGRGDGARNWIVYLEGGGWCISEDDCLDRSHGYLGSSRVSVKTIVRFTGILDDDCVFNPDFCRWNKVFIHYCDGSSFSSNIETIDPRTNLTFRGARIFNATVEEMLAKGLGDAENAILAGTSAGGLSTILHCDMFHAFLPSARVKCISDSGFFIRGEKKGLPGIKLREFNFSRDVVETHKLANTLPSSCTTKRNPDLCLFPEYLVDDIRTPLFINESAFDSYQVAENLFPDVGPRNEWINCTINIALCNETLLNILKDFRVAFIETLHKLNNIPSRGMFVHSCFRHGHIVARDGWTCSSVEGNVLANKAIGQAVGDWYFDRSRFQEIDIQKDLPFMCTRETEDVPNFNQKCFAILPPHINEF